MWPVGVPRVRVGAEVEHVARVERPVQSVRIRPFAQLTCCSARRVPSRVVLDVGRRGSASPPAIASSPDAAVQEVVVPAAEDHVVGVVGVVERRSISMPGVAFGAEVVRRQVDRLLERAADVDRRRLDLTRRVDELVRGRCPGSSWCRGRSTGRRRCRRAARRSSRRCRVRRSSDPGGAVPRVPGAVAAGEDAAVVAEDAVLAGAAGDPVVAPAADQVVVLRVAVDDVVADAAVDGVVAGLAVDLVVAADVDVRC